MVEHLEKKLEELESQYSKTKDNKSSNKYVGALRRKIAEAKREIIESGRKTHGKGFFIKKSGDATVAMIGFPNAGKSSLLNVLADTKSKVGHYAFTTTEAIPGTLMYNNAHIQVLDLPGIIQSAHSGVGGGRQVIAAARSANLIVFVVEVNKTDDLDIILDELTDLNIYINRDSPPTTIVKKETGGIMLDNYTRIKSDDIKQILNELGIYNAYAKIKGIDTIDELIAFVSKKATYLKAIMVLNKIDTETNYKSIAEGLHKKYKMEVITISASNNTNIDILKAAIFRNLDIIRVYLNPKGKKPEPIIVKKNCTVGELAKRIHTEIINEFKCAYINGPSAKFKNQKAGITHVLADSDIVTFIK